MQRRALPIAHQRVHHGKSNKAVKITIGRPKLAHIVLPAQRRNTRVVH
jgi:hypothetical protein